MGVLGPWDEHNQHLAERDNERLGGDGWATRLEAETPGPRWGVGDRRDAPDPLDR